MPPRLTGAEILRRAKAEIRKAWAAHREAQSAGRKSATTTRMRSATRRAGRKLSLAVRRGQIKESAARQVYESAPPDPEFGAVEW